jgi:uncharacterized spore protein YtfJ
MSDSQSSLVERIAELIQVHASARQVYGDPVEKDGTTVIPVAKIQWGFGGGAMGRGAAEARARCRPASSSSGTESRSSARSAIRATSQWSPARRWPVS